MNINDFSALSFTVFFIAISEIENYLRNEPTDSYEEQYVFSKDIFDIKRYFANAIDISMPQRKPYAKTKLEAFFYQPIAYPSVTVMVSNANDGWIQLGRVLSKALKCRRYYFLMNDILDDDAGNYFESSDGITSRTIYALMDTRWVFYAEGDIQPIEDEQHYKKRRIRDRLNKSILIEYCQKLNLDVFDNNFWRSDTLGLIYTNLYN